MRPLILVACCGKKKGTPCAARDLYISPLFKKSRAWAESRGDWLILSALYGVVAPDTVIAPYDVTLTRMPAVKRREWCAHVAAALTPYADREIIALVGAAYLGWETAGFRCVMQPLQGLGIGQRLAWLNRETSIAAGPGNLAS